MLVMGFHWGGRVDVGKWRSRRPSSVPFTYTTWCSFSRTLGSSYPVKILWVLEPPWKHGERPTACPFSPASIPGGAHPRHAERGIRSTLLQRLLVRDVIEAQYMMTILRLGCDDGVCCLVDSWRGKHCAEESWYSKRMLENCPLRSLFVRQVCS